jgi:hypothetical protein
MATYLAGLKEVPIQIDSLSRAENPEEFVKKLIRNVAGSGASCSARWTNTQKDHLISNPAHVGPIAVQIILF